MENENGIGQKSGHFPVIPAGVWCVKSFFVTSPKVLKT